MGVFRFLDSRVPQISSEKHLIFNFCEQTTWKTRVGRTIQFQGVPVEWSWSGSLVQPPKTPTLAVFGIYMATCFRVLVFPMIDIPICFTQITSPWSRPKILQTSRVLPKNNSNQSQQKALNARDYSIRLSYVYSYGMYVDLYNDGNFPKSDLT